MALSSLRRLGLLASLLATGPALAGVVSISQTIQGSQRWQQTLEIARFDSRLGELREIRLQFDFSAEHQYQVANPYDHAIDADLRFVSIFKVNSDGPITASALMTSGITRPLAVSAGWLSGVERQSERETSSYLQHLGAYIGTGTWALRVDSINDVSPSYLTADVPIVGSWNTARMAFQLDYVYDEPPPPPQPQPQPLPEPATPALAALALLAGLAPRLARRGATARP